MFAILGVALAYTPSVSYIVPLVFLLSWSSKNLRITGLVFCCFFLLYAHKSYQFPSEPEIEAQGIFTVESIARQSGPFNKTLLYKGTFGNIPCRVYIPLNKDRPIGSKIPFTGKLQRKDDRNYVLKLKSWENTAPGIPEWRFQLKEAFLEFLHKKIPDSRSRVFLTSMITGDIEERLVSMEFGRLGLQHILGVSGFQFLLIAAALGIVLRLFLPYMWASALLLVLLSAYFFILGPSPPVMRAWAASTLYLLGILLNRPTSAINALGVGLLFELAFDPLVITNIGFQLSFICTAAILLVYPPMHRLFLHLLPRRSLSDLKQFPLLDKHAYIISALLRESLALNAAVHLLALPVLLCLFGKFPLLSLAYNLFFPFLAAISFCLLLASLACPFLFPLCNAFTKIILIITTYPPMILDRAIYFPGMTLGWAVVLTSLIILLSLNLYRKPQDLPGNGKGSLGFG
ncbi:MAG: ComEC/Rec2 family competence protein [Verrucomicrobia bacterium]|nr:ComEC/Rec2 family competence protein [Verrucomicrobiota bacterium]